ncbi:MAG: TRIC cation channel family protein, partial [Bacteroidaceae bacterium]|nr:TRIC cation channel family protein [Bacteroidaceae bacterium]
FSKYLIRLNNTFFLFDAIGLALFVVVGIQKTLDFGFPMWVAIIMGTMTGAAGGVIRDVFINEIPLIFRKEIYAMACVIGGLVFGICLFFDFNIFITHILCGVSVFLTRILSVKYHICLPILKGDE